MKSPCCMSVRLYVLSSLSFCYEAYEITLLSVYGPLLFIFNALRVI
jgi:hypothetical protein